MTQHKLNIFKVLKSIDLKHRDGFQQLTDEERKGFLPVIIQRWLSGTSDKRQIVFLNELSNAHVFELYDHPELLYHLFTISTTGKSKRYKWVKRMKNESSKVGLDCVQQFYNCSTKDAAALYPFITNDQLLEMANRLQWDKKQITALKKELKQHNDSKTSVSM